MESRSEIATNVVVVNSTRLYDAGREDMKPPLEGAEGAERKKNTRAKD